jgi:hypothetical protein
MIGQSYPSNSTNATSVGACDMLRCRVTSIPNGKADVAILVSRQRVYGFTAKSSALTTRSDIAEVIEAVSIDGLYQSG